MSENKINTEEIMEQIRNNIKERGYTEEVLKFDDVEAVNEDRDDLDLIEEYSQQRLRQNIQLARLSCRIEPIRFDGNKAKYYAQRIARKANEFIHFQKNQIAFNLNAAKSLNQIEKYILLADETSSVTKNNVMPFENERAFYKNTEELVQNLENRVVALEAEIEELRKQLDQK